MGKWMYRSTYSWLDTIWRWTVSFTSLPLYPRVKKPRYPLDRRLDGPQLRFGRRGKKQISAIQDLELRTLGHLSRNLSLYRLRYPGTVMNSKWLIKSCFCCLVYAYRSVQPGQNIISVLRMFVLQNHVNLGAIVDFSLEDLSSEAEFYSAARAVGCVLARILRVYLYRGLFPHVHLW
jgi:hypothetical protein